MLLLQGSTFRYNLQGPAGGIVEIFLFDVFFLRMAVFHANGEDDGRDSVCIEVVGIRAAAGFFEFYGEAEFCGSLARKLYGGTVFCKFVRAVVRTYLGGNLTAGGSSACGEVIDDVLRDLGKLFLVAAAAFVVYITGIRDDIGCEYRW